MCCKMTFVDPACSVSANCEFDQEPEFQELHIRNYRLQHTPR